MKTWFSMDCQTRKYLFQEFKYFFSIGVSLSAIKPIRPIILEV